jgi:ribonuclease-3
MPGEARRRRLRALLAQSGAPDLDPAAVEAAFVHESAARESAGRGASNERLEFVGDAILGMVAARWLYATYPASPEGELARRKNALVSGEACARTARRLGFGSLVLLGVGMQTTGGSDNTSILADAFEAYVAALYFATDMPLVARFVEQEHLAQVDGPEIAEADAKTALQEFTQGRYGTIPAYYERMEGPPHDRRFTSQVRVGADVLGEGIGPSKKAAQQSAAAMALAALKARTAPEAPAAPASKPESGRVIELRPRRTPKSPPKAPN